MTKKKVSFVQLTKANHLLGEGYYQVSRRHRILAKFPEGLTGTEALLQDGQHPYNPKWAEDMGEGAAGDHWLRCYAEAAGYWLRVNKAIFTAFRILGGDTYAWTYELKQKGTTPLEHRNADVASLPNLPQHGEK